MNLLIIGCPKKSTGNLSPTMNKSSSFIIDDLNRIYDKVGVASGERSGLTLQLVLYITNMQHDVFDHAYKQGVNSGRLERAGGIDIKDTESGDIGVSQFGISSASLPNNQDTPVVSPGSIKS